MRTNENEQDISKKWINSPIVTTVVGGIFGLVCLLAGRQININSGDTVPKGIYEEVVNENTELKTQLNSLTIKNADLQTQLDNLNVKYSDMKLYINKKRKSIDEVNSVVTINQINYFSLNILEVLINKKISINYDKQTISIGGKSKDTILLTDLDYYSKDGDIITFGDMKDNLGDIQSNVIGGSWSYNYQINKDYNTLRGTIFTPYKNRDENACLHIAIYGDNHIIILRIKNKYIHLITEYKNDIPFYMLISFPCTMESYNFPFRFGDLINPLKNKLFRYYHIGIAN